MDQDTHQTVCPYCGVVVHGATRVARGGGGPPSPDVPPARLTLCSACLEVGVVDLDLITGCSRVRQLTEDERGQIHAIPQVMKAIADGKDIVRRHRTNLRHDCAEQMRAVLAKIGVTVEVHAERPAQAGPPGEERSMICPHGHEYWLTRLDQNTDCSTS